MASNALLPGIKMKKPKVTVLMSVYNGELYVRQAIDSIVNQTLTDFEFIIIDDCSSDGTSEIIKSYRDKRIHAVQHTINMGLTKSLNEGIHLSKGIYIARMDADDISLPERLQKQTEFMDNNRDIGVCGSWIKIIRTKSEIWKPPKDDAEICSFMLFYNAIYHPTAIIRRDVLIKHNLFYDESFRYGQDYDFWMRISKYSRLANIAKVLVHRRVSHKNRSGNYYKKQDETAFYVKRRLLQNLGIHSSEQELKIHRLLSTGSYKPSKQFIYATNNWLVKLIQSNLVKKLYPNDVFARTIATRWLDMCIRSSHLGLWVWNIYRRSSLRRYQRSSLRREIYFALACILQRKGLK